MVSLERHEDISSTFVLTRVTHLTDKAWSDAPKVGFESGPVRAMNRSEMKVTRHHHPIFLTVCSHDAGQRSKSEIRATCGVNSDISDLMPVDRSYPTPTRVRIPPPYGSRMEKPVLQPG